MKPTQLQRIIYKMLIENTGVALCDSGGAYGRSWQRNQKKTIADFIAEPDIKASFDSYNGTLEGDITMSVFHFLCRCLDSYDEVMTRRFRRWCHKGEDRYTNVPSSFEDWVEAIGGRVKDTINTYNGEDLLSQVLQYTLFESPDGDAMVGMSIHGGCDVRGGYTSIRVFSLPHMADHSLYDNARFTLYAENTADIESPVLAGVVASPESFDNGHYWDMECAGYESGYGEWMRYVEGRNSLPPIKNYLVTKDAALKGDGLIYVDPEGNAYSPVNGAKLIASIR